jgi:anti-sigma28 factor (negative regulator of flagellin synthesis)
VRATYVYDPGLKKMVPKGDYVPPNRGPMVLNDIPDFVSPIDGAIVHGRASKRNHMRQHDVVDYREVQESGHYEQKAKERASVLNAESTRGDRIEAIKRAIDQHN